MLIHVDPYRLVRDPLDLSTVRAVQRFDRRALATHPQPFDVPVDQGIVRHPVVMSRRAGEYHGSVDQIEQP